MSEGVQEVRHGLGKRPCQNLGLLLREPVGKGVAACGEPVFITDAARIRRNPDTWEFAPELGPQEDRCDGDSQSRIGLLGKPCPDSVRPHLRKLPDNSLRQINVADTLSPGWLAVG